MPGFGRFQVDHAARRVLRDGVPLALRDTAFEVLLALLERPGRIVGKRALCERAWPELADAENNLQVEISALRKQLGAGLIVTVPGRGYQWAGVDEAGAPAVDIATAEALLGAGRLLTITGEACVGKTQLADALAQHAAQAVTAVLTDVQTDAEDTTDAVWQAIAHALQMPGRPGIAALVAMLNRRRGLLVLDGCDSALPAVADVAGVLLTRCPAWALIATSSEILRLPGERVMRLAAPASALDPAARQQARRLSLTRHVARLPAGERALFAALATLPQPFGLNDVAMPLEACELIETLARLVDKSLVQIVSGEPPGYRLSDAARCVAQDIA